MAETQCAIRSHRERCLMTDSNDTTVPLEPTPEAAPPVAPGAPVAPPAYAAEPYAPYEPVSAPDHKHRDRVVLAWVGALLGVIVLFGTFAVGVAVGSHIGRGRMGFAAHGQMMGRGFGQGSGYGQGQGQGNGYGYGQSQGQGNGYGYGRRGLRGNGSGQSQLPQGHPTVPQGQGQSAPQTAPQGQTTPQNPNQ
jgi:hypothetical protein